MSSNGLFRGQTYYVLEGNPVDYRPTGYVYGGSDSYTDDKGKVVYIDPRVSNNGMVISTWTDVETNIVNDQLKDSKICPNGNGTGVLPAFAVLVTGNATGSVTTIFVVNSLDENKVSATGIFVDNLPYILMIGVPLVVFAGMFIAKRRSNAA